jgi:hypothetical protein
LLLLLARRRSNKALHTLSWFKPQYAVSSENKTEAELVKPARKLQVKKDFRTLQEPARVLVRLGAVYYELQVLQDNSRCSSVLSFVAEHSTIAIMCAV